jgi:hypothetical protein
MHMVRYASTMGSQFKLLISRVLSAAPLAGFEPISHRHSRLRSNKLSCNRETMHIANRKAAKMGGLLRSAKGALSELTTA